MKIFHRVRLRFSLLSSLEASLWLSVAAGALYAAYVGLTSEGYLGSEHDYMLGYVVASLLLSPILAGILISPFLAKSGRTRIGITAVASPTLLLVIILHITAWGVSASPFLVWVRPQLGISLWLFTQVAVPISLVLVSTYVFKLFRAARNRPSPESSDPSTLKRENRSSLRQKRLFASISTLLVIQFLMIATGAAITGASVKEHWYSQELTAWTHGTVVVSVSFLVFALIAVTWLVDTRAKKAVDGLLRGRSLSGEPNGAVQAEASEGFRTGKIVLGPLFAGSAILAVSIVAILLSETMRADFGLNTATVLFVSYSYSLYPSYVLLCVLHLLRMRGLRIAKVSEAVSSVASTQS